MMGLDETFRNDYQRVEGSERRRNCLARLRPQSCKFFGTSPNFGDHRKAKFL